jgi:hypothetical protein
MSDPRSLLKRESGRFIQADGAFERLVRRRDHKRRNQRVAAGVLGIAVFALAAIGFVRLLGWEEGSVIGPATSPSSTAAPQPSPAPGFSTFSSPLHGITIDYPAGWKVKAATEPWGHGPVAFGASNVDVIFDPKLRDDLFLALVSEPLGGKSATEWVDHTPWDQNVGICKDKPGWGGGGGRYSVDGAVDGWFESCGPKPKFQDSNQLVAVATATSGYIIYLHVGDDRRLLATYDGDWFEAALETVDLRPEDAVDALNPSESP